MPNRYTFISVGDPVSVSDVNEEVAFVRQVLFYNLFLTFEKHLYYGNEINGIITEVNGGDYI